VQQPQAHPGAEWVLVFDIGGTSLRAARFHRATGKLTDLQNRATPSHWTMPHATARDIQARLLDEMQKLSRCIFGDESPPVLSVAFPGPIDSRGQALSAPTVWGDRETAPFPVRKELQRLWPQSRVIVMNDVTAAGYRYLQNGAGDFCIVTVSSGIGLKMFVNGRPLLGAGGRGGEIGHVRVDFSDSAPRCDCGQLGHLGAVASGRGALEAARQRAGDPGGGFSGSALGRSVSGDLNHLDNPAIVAAFLDGDPWTSRLIADVAAPLGRMLAALHSAAGIERFVIIGGFALALGEKYRAELVRAAESACWNLGQDWNAMIRLGEPDDLAGLIGAGRCAMQADGGIS
jgi:C7-cyclitol 7-kinase